MSERSITVLKFGSSILRDEGDLPAVVAEIGALVAARRTLVGPGPTLLENPVPES